MPEDFDEQRRAQAADALRKLAKEKIEQGRTLGDASRRFTPDELAREAAPTFTRSPLEEAMGGRARLDPSPVREPVPDILERIEKAIIALRREISELRGEVAELKQAGTAAEKPENAD